MPEKTAAQKHDKVVHLAYLNTWKNSKYNKQAHYKLN